MKTSQDVRTKKVERIYDVITELPRFSFDFWQTVILFLFLCFLDVIVGLWYPKLSFFDGVICALFGIFCSLCYWYVRPLTVRIRAKKLLREVNTGNADAVLSLGKSLHLNLSTGYGMDISDLKKAVMRCPAKEFAIFLCSLMYVESVERLRSEGKDYHEDDIIKGASFFLRPNSECHTPFIEYILTYSKCARFSSRMYVREFIKGLLLSRHSELANIFLDSLASVLEKRREERKKVRNMSCFEKTVRLITKP